MVFKEMAPFVILITILLCALIAYRIKKRDVFSIDGAFCMAGFLGGLAITFLNLIKSNSYMITLGPMLAITSLLYIRFREKILPTTDMLYHTFTANTYGLINLAFWASILLALVSQSMARIYQQLPLFFICISLAVTALALEIVSLKPDNNAGAAGIMSRIVLASLILRGGAYFISSYPVGADPWAHTSIIGNILAAGSLNFLGSVSPYYSSYPIMHLFVASACLLGNLNTKEGMFIVGVALTLSTIFVYLIVKRTTSNENVALLSMLFLSFADFFIKWGIDIIAMSFGIAIYCIIIYLALKNRPKKIDIALLIGFFALIALTHTLSSFIALISVICIFVGSHVYNRLYGDENRELPVSIFLCSIFIIILLTQWSFASYDFLDIVVKAFAGSLKSDAKFLGSTAQFGLQENIYHVLNIIGFLIFFFLGTLGILSSLSKKNATEAKVALIFLLAALFFVFFIFPVMGLRNIMPFRWPAFIYVSLVLFVTLGLSGLLNVISQKYRVAAFVAILFTLAFFMITNFVANGNTPVYGADNSERLFWTDSEINSLARLNRTYDGAIMADIQTNENLLYTYLKHNKSRIFELTPAGVMDWNNMTGMLVIWRETSLNSPVEVMPYTDIVLGKGFKDHLDKNFDDLYDAGTIKAYYG